MLRAAIVEKSKEHREYIRAGLQGLNMEMQVSEFSNEYDYLENVGEEASAFDILLLNTTIRHEGDGIRLAAEIRSRNRKVMICFITAFPEILCRSVFCICYRLPALSR